MKINEYFKDYLEFWGGITIFDDRKDDKRELPDDLKNQLKNKIEDFIAKKYGKDEYSEEKDDWIAFPFTKINITNNVHSYAKSVSRSNEYGGILIDKIEGDTTPGEYDYSDDYKGSKSPDYSMDKIQISEISQPNSTLAPPNLAIYIPDKDKKEKGSFKKKYERTFLEQEDKSYYDNTQKREPIIIDLHEIFPSLEKIPEYNESIDNENIDINPIYTGHISVDKLDAFSKSASRNKIKEFLDEAIKEINNQNMDKEI